MLKVYTPTIAPLGLEYKKKVHQEGLWHKTFGGIIYNPQLNTIYLQTTYPKESYTFARPDYVDFGVGEHVEDDKIVLRETKEGFRQKVAVEHFHYISLSSDRIIPDYFTDKSILEKFLVLKSIIC